ncbi:putative dephospho- kinase protein [Phaeoacremonium minimum UCRPA7]|uniref:Putative dephospho-kinase protein n=1 Tax=Phaeoacremonium minimum (strain UCR-PA7) TaxID=1286976 RepID=R8BTP1_PHAM7|nr:putative dephospho- kinase protein [Phaeoacremonium minimum UCRPA7]EOO02758.1 putative dephospho- kinase protein [Phaeoacremonium minimum UCRPA7]
MAANYQNAFPYNYGVHFQPQVPDTSAGAMVHTYVPRFDNAPGVVAVAGQPQPGILPANTVQYQNGVPFAPAVGPTVPLVNQQPAYQPAQIMMANGSTPVMSAPIQGIPPMMGGAPPLIVGGQPQFMPGTMTPDSTHFEPATGIGLTGMEVAADQAQNPELCEPQDFKPASDDPSRMYWVRQCDGCWTALSRAAIDGVGDCRWYVMPNGVFYAVRLPS